MKNGRVAASAAAFTLLTLGTQASTARATEIGCQNLQSTIDESIQKNIQQIDLPPNTRCLSEPLVISGARNLTIDGHGSTIIFTHWDKPGISILNYSSNVNVKNIYIDYDPVPYTQGRITAVNGNYAKVEIDSGYQPISAFSHLDRAYLFDSQSRLWKRKSRALYSRQIQQIDSRTGSIKLRDQDISQVQVGDLIAIPPRLSPAILISGLSSNTALEGVTILASPGMGILSRFVQGDNRFQVVVTRGPRPKGAVADRLLSTNADAFNYAYARKGPKLTNSTIGFQGDDGVNLHGPALAISARDGANGLILAQPYGSDGSLIRLMQTGDPVRLLAKDDFSIIKTASLVKIEKIQPPKEATTQIIRNYYPKSRLKTDKSFTYYRLTLDNLPPDAGSFVDFPAINAPNFDISGNEFHDNRGHGIVSGASNGRIDGNRISRSTQNGIVIGANYSPWRESGWVNNVIVSNNNITDSCHDPDMTMAPGAWAFGAITVGARIDSKIGNPKSGNSDIQITNNSIIGCENGTAIYLNFASRVKLKGNTSSKLGNIPDENGKISYLKGPSGTAVGSVKDVVDEK